MQGHRRRKNWTSTESPGQDPFFNEDCIFCRIVARGAEATIVYEDHETLSFLDVHPLNPGHTLVISKKHYTNMLEMPTDEAGRVFATVAKVMKSVRKVSGADGISIGQ